MAWDDYLARPILLADGTRLRTLKQAGHQVSTLSNSPLLEDAIILLMRASTSGARIDVEAATKVVEALLFLGGMTTGLAPSARPAAKRKAKGVSRNPVQPGNRQSSVPFTGHGTVERRPHAV